MCHARPPHAARRSAHPTASPHLHAHPPTHRLPPPPPTSPHLTSPHPPPPTPHSHPTRRHIVDSQSFPCGSDTYPQLAAKGAYAPAAIYSPADLRTAVAYAKARGVRILPEWDVPGHGAWGAGIPSIMGCAEVLDPTQDYTYEVLAGFLGEMAGIFEDDWMFLGGDEVDYRCWDDNAAISAWLAAHNMTSAQLQQYFWQQMGTRVLPTLNKTIGVWEADALQVRWATGWGMVVTGVSGSSSSPASRQVAMAALPPLTSFSLTLPRHVDALTPPPAPPFCRAIPPRRRST
jgi:hypothetical protein